MPLPCSIENLPAEAREALDGWLQDPAVTQKEATRRVNELLETSGQGEQRLSRQAVNRYDLRLRGTAERKRQARIITEIWADKFGSETDGQVGQLIIELLRMLTFDFARRLQNGELDHASLPDVIDAADRVALMAEQLESSSEISARLEREAQRVAKEERKAKAPLKPLNLTEQAAQRARERVRKFYRGEIVY